MRAIVADFEDEVELTVTGNDLLGEIIMQELYNLCVKLNPWLDIKVVILPDERA